MWRPIVFQGEKKKRRKRGNDIRLSSLAALGCLQNKCFLLQHRRVAVHEMRERSKIVLIQQRNGELGLQ